MSLMDATSCTFCGNGLEFIKPSGSVSARIGNCRNCGGAPAHCLKCGTRATVVVHEDMKCPNCGCDKMGEFVVPTKFSS